MLLTYYGLTNILDEEVSNEAYNQWERFEVELENLDYKQVLEDKSDYAACLGSPDFRDGNWRSWGI